MHDPIITHDLRIRRRGHFHYTAAAGGGRSSYKIVQFKIRPRFTIYNVTYFYSFMRRHYFMSDIFKLGILEMLMRNLFLNYWYLGQRNPLTYLPPYS